MKSPHRHWEVVAYNGINDKQNLYLEAVYLTIFDALNEDWAINEAKSIVKRNLYKLSRIWECRQCAYLEKAEAFMDKQMGDE